MPTGVGGAGGAAGGGDGTNSGRGGGGGGSAEAAIFILCDSLVNNGTIQANGGNGGNGGAGAQVTLAAALEAPEAAAVKSWYFAIR